jgi:hypothetical protein
MQGGICRPAGKRIHEHCSLNASRSPCNGAQQADADRPQFSYRRFAVIVYKRPTLSSDTKLVVASLKAAQGIESTASNAGKMRIQSPSAEAGGKRKRAEDE